MSEQLAGYKPGCWQTRQHFDVYGGRFRFKGLILFLLTSVPICCHNGIVFAQHSQKARCKHTAGSQAVPLQVVIFRGGVLFYQTKAKKISSERKTSLSNLRLRENRGVYLIPAEERGKAKSREHF